MKNILIKLTQHPKYDTFVTWGKLISITGSAQIIVQAVGFASGILIIRLLPVQEYALYTLANTMLGTMALLSDGGISTGVMASGGKVWQDRERLGAVLATGFDLRRNFSIGSLVISTPILFYLLLHNNASWLTSSLIILALIPAFYATLSDSLLEIAPKLHQAILPLQRNQVNVGIGRLLLTSLTLFVFPWAALAIVASGIPRIYGNIKLRKITEGFVDKEQKPNATDRKDILQSVKKIMPNLIYVTFSGQIVIWLLSIFGTTTSIAQIGALGRIAIVFSIFGAIIGQLVVPRFVRLPNDKQLLLKRYLQINLIVILFSVVILFFVWLFSSEILWILGDKYKNLNFELLLCMFGSVIAQLHGVSFVLCGQRGWLISPFIAIGTDFIAIITGILLFNVTSLQEMLWFNIFIGTVLLIQNVAFAFIKLTRL